MSTVSIVTISNPKEFVEKIQVEQKQFLYLYTEDIFSPIHNIEDKILKVYNACKVPVIYTDIQMKYNGSISNQYFNDIEYNKQKTIIYSPLCVGYLPVKLEIYDNLTYHCTSFLYQLTKYVPPWHIPELGFRADFNNKDFQQLTDDSKWVLQHVT